MSEPSLPQLAEQVSEHRVKIGHLSDELHKVNANVNTVLSDQKSMRTFIELSGKRTEDLIGALKEELKSSDTQYVRDRSEDSKRPSTIRQSVLFQIITLVVTVSGGLYLGFQKGINEVNAISEKRHTEQEKVIFRERDKSDLQLTQWGDYREWKGQTDTKRLWDRSDIDAQKQDLAEYEKRFERDMQTLIAPIKERLDQQEATNLTQ